MFQRIKVLVITLGLPIIVLLGGQGVGSWNPQG